MSLKIERKLQLSASANHRRSESEVGILRTLIARRGTSLELRGAAVFDTGADNIRARETEYRFYILFRQRVRPDRRLVDPAAEILLVVVGVGPAACASAAGMSEIHPAFCRCSPLAALAESAAAKILKISALDTGVHTPVIIADYHRQINPFALSETIALLAVSHIRYLHIGLSSRKSDGEIIRIRTVQRKTHSAGIAPAVTGTEEICQNIRRILEGFNLKARKRGIRDRVAHREDGCLNTSALAVDRAAVVRIGRLREIKAFLGRQFHFAIRTDNRNFDGGHIALRSIFSPFVRR